MTYRLARLRREEEVQLGAHIQIDRAARGRAGEEAAALYLAGRGCRVVARNPRTPSGELDLVCRDADHYVFVEVKARANNEYGTALEAVGARKARRLRASAAWWLAEHGLLPCLVRFDVVTVSLDGEGCPRSVQHFRDVLSDVMGG